MCPLSLCVNYGVFDVKNVLLCLWIHPFLRLMAVCIVQVFSKKLASVEISASFSVCVSFWCV